MQNQIKKGILSSLMDSSILTVSELTASIKAHLEPRFQRLQVQGEISNFKLQASGHLYFSLKDSAAQLSAVLFRGQAARLSRMPKEGDQVIALGEISLYAPRGTYQLVIREMQFVGLGALLLQLEARKQKLAALGWFDPARKKKLPKIPKTIGVVTSPTGAVIQDILNVLRRRFAGFHVILNPVKVQGEGAAQEIGAAIDAFNQHNLADVLIVGRGGGSIEDLWAFNEEIVAEAIYRSKIPVISAVGHETDFTIADWVADVRAPTPSAAAEIATAEKEGLLRFLASAKAICQSRLHQQLAHSKQQLVSLQRHPLFRSPYALLAEPMQKLDLFTADLTASIRLQLSRKKEKLSGFKKHLEALRPEARLRQIKDALAIYQERFKSAAAHLLAFRKERLSRITNHLRSIHPKNLMQKGYSLVFLTEGRSLISKTSQVKPDTSVTIRLFDGELLATLTHVKTDDPNHCYL